MIKLYPGPSRSLFWIADLFSRDIWIEFGLDKYQIHLEIHLDLHIQFITVRYLGILKEPMLGLVIWRILCSPNSCDAGAEIAIKGGTESPFADVCIWNIAADEDLSGKRAKADTNSYVKFWMQHPNSILLYRGWMRFIKSEAGAWLRWWHNTTKSTRYALISTAESRRVPILRQNAADIA